LKTNSIGDTLRTRVYEAENDDWASSVKQTFDDGYILVGLTRSVSLGAEDRDLYLIRTDSLGNPLWTPVKGGWSYDQGWAVTQSADNGYIVAGYTTSIGAGEGDGWLIKLKPEPWQKKADMPTPRWALSSCTIYNKIYVVGGIGGDSSMEDPPGIAATEMYDPLTDTWDTLADMAAARGYLSACAVNGKIYAIGGAASVWSTNNLAVVEEYDPVANTWARKTDIPTPRALHSASVVNDKIYVIGGFSGEHVPCLKTVEEHDPLTDNWTTKADMNTGRELFASCELNGKIYVFGGAISDLGNTTNSAEVYDPTRDTWASIAPMPEGRYGHVACAVAGKIRVFGGATKESDHVTLNTIFEYDPQTDAWSTLTNMPIDRVHITTCMGNDKIYMIGGTKNPWPHDPITEVWEYNPVNDPTTEIEREYHRAVVPNDYILYQNSPNPFSARGGSISGGNPITSIEYALPVPGHVRLAIYDLLGRKVRTLVDTRQEAGHFKTDWNGRDKFGVSTPTGVYFCRMEVGNYIKVIKLALVR